MLKANRKPVYTIVLGLILCVLLFLLFRSLNILENFEVLPAAEDVLYYDSYSKIELGKELKEGVLSKLYLDVTSSCRSASSYYCYEGRVVGEPFRLELSSDMKVTALQFEGVYSAIKDVHSLELGDYVLGERDTYTNISKVSKGFLLEAVFKEGISYYEFLYQLKGEYYKIKFEEGVVKNIKKA